MEQHCIVKDCKNTGPEMVFYNGICAQCYMYLTQGVGNGQVYRNIIKTLLRSLFVYLKKVDSDFAEELPVIKSEPEPQAPVQPTAKMIICEVPPEPKEKSFVR